MIEVEMLIIGWMFGIMTCLLYATIADYVRIKRRNHTHQQLLDAGMDPLDILKLGL